MVHPKSVSRLCFHHPPPPKTQDSPRMRTQNRMERPTMSTEAEQPEMLGEAIRVQARWVARRLVSIAVLEKPGDAEFENMVDGAIRLISQSMEDVARSAA